MKKSYLLAFSSILIWSTMATVSKLLLKNLNSLYVLCLSSFFATVFLFILIILNGKIKELKNYRVKDYFIIMLEGIPGIFLYNLFYYLGGNYLLASQAFTINYLWPIMSVIFACIILKEKITIKKIVAIILSFSGVFFVAGNVFSATSGTVLYGVFFCLLAAVSYGLFTALTQLTDYDKTISMMLYHFAAFILSGIILLFVETKISISGLEMVGLAYNGVFVMAIASTTWALALKSGKTVKISNFAYITPFLSLIWTYIILNEKISYHSLVGLTLIILGILIQCIELKKDSSKKYSPQG